MRATFFQKTVIMSKLAYWMLDAFGKTIWRGFRGTITREWIDHYVRIWSQRMLSAVKATYSIHNPHQVTLKPQERYIIMCNHNSQYDIPLCFMALPGSIRILAKKELAKIPLMGGAMKAAGFPTINRHNREEAKHDLQKVQMLMSEGIVILFYPEGTRSLTGKLGKLKKGGFITAINAQAKIIPIGIRGADAILPAKTTQFHLNQHVEIHIGEPVDTSDYTLENKDKLIKLVHERLHTLVGQK